MRVHKLSHYCDRVLRALGRSRLPGRFRILSHLVPFDPHRGARPFIVDLHGIEYHGDLSSFIDWQIYYFGTYGGRELSFLASCAAFLRRRQPEVNFFDVGANVGEYSLFMARHATAVHAFEPNRELAERLEVCMTRNALDHVHVHRIALGAADHDAELGSGFAGNPGSRSLTWSLPGATTSTVTVRRGDRYCAEHDLPRIHIIKIDVEGYESLVIGGLSARLRADRPIVLMELIGTTSKGGFASEAELRQSLYPRHILKSLDTRVSPFRLIDFDWSCEAAVVLPEEYVDFY